ncbi:MAG: GntR family transcriptional regulator [Clostridia bacterium]|nr:GntR family transcriptional regulator [Clostridia bacterium]
MPDKRHEIQEMLDAAPDTKLSKVYRQIKEDILNDVYPPGSTLVERRLCEIYEVSRSPIRNALQQLAHEGLLSHVPGQGMVVPEFRTEDILEVYDLMEVLQVYGVKSFIRAAAEAERQGLGDILRRMGEDVSAGRLGAAGRYDREFHNYIVAHAHNARLCEIFARLDAQSVRFRASGIRDAVHMERALKEHQAIFAYISAGDEEAAGAAVHLHYQSLRAYYVDKLVGRII